MFSVATTNANPLPQIRSDMVLVPQLCPDPDLPYLTGYTLLPGLYMRHPLRRHQRPASMPALPPRSANGSAPDAATHKKQISCTNGNTCKRDEQICEHNLPNALPNKDWKRCKQFGPPHSPT